MRFTFVVFFFLVSPATQAQERGFVAVDSTPLYSEMSVTSPEVTVLHKDELVTIKFSITGSDRTWCSITQLLFKGKPGEGQPAEGKSGKVPCEVLERRGMLQREGVVNSDAPAEATSRNSLPEAISRAKRIPPSAANSRVYFVPLGGFTIVDGQYLVRYYKQKFGLPVTLLPPAAIDPRSYNTDRKQFQAERLIRSLKDIYPALAADRRAILIGITEADIYIESENWVFALGYRDENHLAVVSTARMDLDHANFGVPSDPRALHARLTRMISRNLGFLYYQLPFSPNPQSVVRTSIMGTDELDEIGEDF